MGRVGKEIRTNRLPVQVEIDRFSKKRKGKKRREGQRAGKRAE